MRRIRWGVSSVLSALVATAAVVASASGAVAGQTALGAPVSSGRGHEWRAETAAARAGDWEVSGAARGSFALNTPLQGGDLVLSLEERCRTSSGIAKVPGVFSLPQFGFYVSQTGAVDRSATVTVPKLTVVVDGKTVTFGGGHEGRLRLIGRLGADAGRLTFSFGGRDAGSCTVPPTTFDARHGSRLALRDGEWHGRAANGQPVLFGVGAGGRAVMQPTASAAVKDPAEIFDRLLSFEFGRGCVDYDGGASCPTTTPSSNGPPPQPCLHVSFSAALIGGDRVARLELQDSNGIAPAGAIDASVKLRFTSRTRAVGTYSQPGDPACSSRFTASAP